MLPTFSNFSFADLEIKSTLRLIFDLTSPDPSILIFDESTSALDVKTENNLLDSIYNLKNKKTLIIISHKESILNRCDTIYKIENKKIVKIN